MKRQWTHEQIETLVTMWNEDAIVKDIALAVGKTHRAVSRYVDRNREVLGLAYRNPIESALRGQKNYWERKRAPEFEQQWTGPVVRGHWLITKPWRSGHAQAA